jgi:hypothetical protein
MTYSLLLVALPSKIIVSPSAYPFHYRKALASETILPISLLAVGSLLKESTFLESEMRGLIRS